jgi:hypothetical protein
VTPPPPPPESRLNDRPPAAAADLTVARSVARMLQCDASSLALRPTTFSLNDLCDELYDPSTAQPIRTSKGQASAWKHWQAWCAANNTDSWRLTRYTSDTEWHREAVLQAGFLRFTHVRQSAKPRNGRQAALVSSAVKTLCHIRKMHKDRGYPLCSASLVNVHSKRLHREYKVKYGVHDMVPKRKEPFSRTILENNILQAQSGLDLGFANLDWNARHGRSLRGLTATLSQTGLRKGEVSVLRAGDPCSADCMSRAALRWYLRGKFFNSGQAPVAWLDDPQDGDFAVLTPCPSKSDPFDMVWGGNPIWLPFLPDEPLCAMTALAAIEIHDPLNGSAADTVALFTNDDGLPFSGYQLDRALRNILEDTLPPDTCKLYSWHSARIFLATMLMESGASHAQIRALCRWQTDDSIAIYARLNSLKYKHLLQSAMRANVTTARANNLAHALPFIDIADVIAATARQPSVTDADLNYDPHPDDDADVDGLDDAPNHTAAQPPASPRTQHSRKRRVTATPATPPAPAAPTTRTVQLQYELVTVSACDPYALAGTSVSLPNKIWPEFSGSDGSARCTVLGNTVQDAQVLAIDAEGFAYEFAINDILRFFPATTRARIRRQLKRVR